MSDTIEQAKYLVAMRGLCPASEVTTSLLALSTTLLARRASDLNSGELDSLRYAVVAVREELRRSGAPMLKCALATLGKLLASEDK